MTSTIRAYTLAITVACFVAGLNAPALAQGAQPADFIVALVNSEPITNAEVKAEVRRVLARLTAQRQSVPPMSELQRGVLERMINDRAQLQVARETGVRVEESSVDLAEQNVARQNQVTLEELHRNLAKDKIEVATFRSQLRDQLTLSRLHEREVDSRVRISDQDIDRYLQDLQAKNTDPYAKEINLAQILIAVPEKATAEQSGQIFVQAQKVLTRLRAGEEFVRVMQEVSAAERANGGQLGLRRGDRYPTSFVEATQNLGVGGISEIVRSGAGFHILQVIEKRNPATVTKTAVQTRAKHILLRPTATLPEAAALARLADFKKRIQSGSATFASVAREYSQDGSAAQGGDLGWANPGMFVPEFEEVMNRLAEGEISNPMVSRFGVHLIQLTERRRVEMSPRDIRDSVRNLLKEQRVEETYATWSQDIRNRAFVEMREPVQ
jgi:peptidyl-prolyl cis-trans isomerase SurA